MQYKETWTKMCSRYFRSAISGGRLPGRLKLLRVLHYIPKENIRCIIKIQEPFMKKIKLLVEKKKNQTLQFHNVTGTIEIGAATSYSGNL